MQTNTSVRADVDRAHEEGSVHHDPVSWRVCAEFREMPGLRLTLTQAARLFNLDIERCRLVFETLVRSGTLTTDGRHFAGAGDHRRRLLAPPTRRFQP